MELSWRGLGMALNDIAHVYEGRSRYKRAFQLVKTLEKVYRKDKDNFHAVAADKIADLCEFNGAMWIKLAQYFKCAAAVAAASHFGLHQRTETGGHAHAPLLRLRHRP